MSDLQFGYTGGQGTNIMVRNKTEGYDYNEILRWTEESGPAEGEPFEPSRRRREAAES